MFCVYFSARNQVSQHSVNVTSDIFMSKTLEPRSAQTSECAMVDQILSEFSEVLTAVQVLNLMVEGNKVIFTNKLIYNYL